MFRGSSNHTIDAKGRVIIPARFRNALKESGNGDNIIVTRMDTCVFAYGFERWLEIEKDISRSMESKVWLKNGAYIIIQQTEAMVSIDVNSGKFIGRKDHETNSLRINLEAAREIARQARLRDLGGLIVIDFIDVIQDANKRKIYQELKREFFKDRSITKIEEMSRFGLIEMTRQRIRPSVLHSMHED